MLLFFLLNTFGFFLRKATKVLQLLAIFQKGLDKPKRKSNKIWGDKDIELYKRLMASWLQDNGIEICSTYKEEKSVVAERLGS